ncbi:hypothetical protein ACFQ9X_55425 [Catenulispora yoronensis]
MKNMRMAWTAAVAAGVVVLGAAEAVGPWGRPGRVGGRGRSVVLARGCGHHRPVRGTADAAEASGASTAAGSPSGEPGRVGERRGVAVVGRGRVGGSVRAGQRGRRGAAGQDSEGRRGSAVDQAVAGLRGNRYCLVNDGEADSAQVGIGPITKEEFDLQKMDPDSKAVGGLGEEALYSPSDGMLKVLKNGKLLSVWVIHGGFGGDDPATLTEEKAIAQIAVGRM